MRKISYEAIEPRWEEIFEKNCQLLLDKNPYLSLKSMFKMDHDIFYKYLTTSFKDLIGRSIHNQN
jgi:hypothetical protein